LPDNKQSKQTARKLEEIDANGRVTSTRIEHDLDDIILNSFPELKEEYEQIKAKKKKGEVLPYITK